MKVILSILSVIIILVSVGCAPATSSKQDFLSDYHGLNKATKGMAAKTFQQDIDALPQYKKIFLDTIVVRKPKDAQNKKVTEDERVMLKRKLHAQLKESLQNQGLTVVSAPTEDSLSIRVAITDFTPGNPTVFKASYAPYISAASTLQTISSGKRAGAGSATFEAEILHSKTKKRHFAIIQHRSGTRLQLKAGFTRYGHIYYIFDEIGKTLGNTLTGKK